MNCSECGYIHKPYCVEDIQTSDFMKKFILHQKYLDHVGKYALEQCKKFDGFHKHRINLEKIYQKNQKFTTAQQKAWDELESIYLTERTKRTELLQKMIDVCKHEGIPLPEWLNQHKWLST